MSSFLGSEGVPELLRVPGVAGSTAGRGSVPSYPGVEAAVRALARVVDYAVWLRTPVRHPRDIRSELMVKLALLDRSGTDPRDLLQAQLAQLLPVAAALDDRLRATTGFEHTLALWRHEAMTATLRFLEALTLPNPAQKHVRTG